MSSFIFKKFSTPPNPNRLCDGDDRRVFFWDGGGIGGQADNWGAESAEIDALFYQKEASPDDLNQLLSVDSAGRVVNYYAPSGVSQPNPRGVGAVDLQMVRNNSNQVAEGTGSALLAGANNRAVGVRSVVLGGQGMTASINDTTVTQNLQLQGGSADSSFFAVTYGTSNTTTIQARTVTSEVQVAANTPDGTIIVLRNSNPEDPIDFTFTAPLQFAGVPSGGGVANTLSLPSRGAVIVYKAGNNFVIISYFDPATA